jgi:plastocyanin
MRGDFAQIGVCRMNSKKQVVSLLIVIATLFLTVAMAFPTNVLSQSSPNTYVVTVGGDLPHPGGESMYMGYSPSVIVIRAGDTVVWKALDGPHTVTSENLTADGKPLFDSNPKVSFPLPAEVFGPGGFIPPGGIFTLDTSTLSPGTYGVLCSIHQDSGMNATLTITNQTAVPGAQFMVVTGISSGNTEVEEFIPKNITVPRGTKVLFTNLSGFEVHTVLSVVTLPNGTQVLGTLFDSSPMIAPPGITMDQVPAVNAQGVTMLGGAMLPVPGLDTFSYTFNDPGTYVYYCKYHSAVENGNIAGMVGEVIVLPSYAASSNPIAQGSAISSQIGTASALGVAGVILGAVGIVLALAVSRKNVKRTQA